MQEKFFETSSDSFPMDISGDEVVAPTQYRAGAESDHEAATDEDLPMIVWLRGDEPIASEFTLDAEAAMTELGIRRSRLTQISGKELRVGKIRLDRYIRPVYRPSDLSAYKKWTRATASHQRSSKMVEQASKRLAAEAERLQMSFNEALSEANHSLTQVIRSHLQTLKKQQTVEAKKQKRTLTRLTKEVNQTKTRGHTALIQIKEFLTAANASTQRSADLLGALADGIAELAGQSRGATLAVKDLKAELLTQGQALAQQCALASSLAEQLAELREEHTHARIALTSQVEGLATLLREATAKTPEPPLKKPTRAIPRALRHRLLMR